MGDSSLHLHKQTLASKLHQHDGDRIEGLEEKLHAGSGDQEGQELVELENRERAFEESLKFPTAEEQRESETGWDLMGEMEEPQTAAPPKGKQD